MLDRSVGGQGCVIGVAGPAGIGKSRLVRETAALAKSRGVEVFSAFCESHTREIPFHAAARLLRAVGGITDLDDQAARAHVHAQVPDADPEDLVLLYDLLGIRDLHVAVPNIDPDARRQQLSALINSVSRARTEPAPYIIEDAHWINLRVDVAAVWFINDGFLPQEKRPHPHLAGRHKRRRAPDRRAAPSSTGR